METPELSLQGVGVLVTRPAHQAESLCIAIRQHGGHPAAFPTLEITPVEYRKELDLVLDRLDDFQWAIFISVNAVEQGLREVFAIRQWPASLKVAAIGKRSQQALEQQGLLVDLVPQQAYSSEALLLMPELQQLRNQKIIIFRGIGGRELLATSLRERGASVEYAEVYRRTRPNLSAEELLQKWADGDLDIVQTNSVESFDNLVAMLGDSGAPLLQSTPVLVPSERMRQALKKRGFDMPVVIARDATDQSMLDALLAWVQGVQ